MIDIKELRVGNWVLNPELVQDYENNPNPVDFACERINRIDELFDHDEYEPIPLTQEILLKCGFEDEDGGFGRWLRLDYDIHNKNRHMLYKVGVERVEMCSRGVTTADAPLKHLHQLQNLYFALTRKELNVEL